MDSADTVYRRRKPESTELYQVLAEHLAIFLARVEIHVESERSRIAIDLMGNVDDLQLHHAFRRFSIGDGQHVKE